jgi:flagellar biosynthesis/type III secretory pathway M-ring protein FliF/YscJ
MEDISILFGLGLVLFVLIGPWILVAVVNRRRKREREEDQKRVAEARTPPKSRSRRPAVGQE